MLRTSPLVGFWNEGAAQLLRKTLEERGMTVERLAEDLQLDPRTIRYWMRTTKPPKHPSVQNFPKLCAALGLSEDDFRRAAEAYAAGVAEDNAPLNRAESSVAAVVETATEREELGQLSSPDSPDIGRPTARRSDVAWAVGIVVLAGFVMLVFWLRSRREHARPIVSSYSIPSFDENYEEAWAAKVSPDGRYVAFNAVNLERAREDPRKLPPRQVFVLSTERGARAVPIPGTDGVYTTFFWDDASRGLYFIRDKKLMYASTDGSPPKGDTVVEGGTYGDANAAGDVVLGSRRGLYFISPSGHSALRSAPSSHLFPTFLPDGERFLYIEQRRDQNGNATRDLYLMSLRNRTPKLIERNVPSRVEYSRGYILYVRNCALLARRFDLDSERLSPEEHRIKDDVWMEDVSGTASFSTSSKDLLVTQAPARVSSVQRIRLTTRGIERESLPIDEVRAIAVSAARDDLVITRADRCKQTQTLWRWPLTGASPECLTCGRSSSTSPILARDGQTVYFAATRGNVMGIYSLAIDTQAEQLVFDAPDFPAPRDLLPDGGGLIIQMTANRDGNLFTIKYGSRVATPEIATPEMEGEAARFSPDGQWLAFSTVRESGGGIFVVRAGRPASEARLIGPRGWRCRWSDDGRSIYYAERHAVMEYDLQRDTVRTLFELDANIAEIAPAGDSTFYVVTTRESHNRVDGDWTRILGEQR